MNKEKFHKLLKESDLSKKQFSGLIGATAQSVNNWGSGERGIPYWVESWLNLYIENKKLKNIKELIQDSGLVK